MNYTQPQSFRERFNIFKWRCPGRRASRTTRSTPQWERILGSAQHAINMTKSSVLGRWRHHSPTLFQNTFPGLDPEWNKGEYRNTHQVLEKEKGKKKQPSLQITKGLFPLCPVKSTLLPQWLLPKPMDAPWEPAVDDLPEAWMEV